MGFFSRLFGSKKKVVVPETPSVLMEKPRQVESSANTGISYDPELVKKLKEDHQSLFKIYEALTATTNRGDYTAIQPLLSELKLAFQTHIMLENVKFYVYLQQSLSHDPELTAFLTEVRQEMNGIARALVKFVNAYSTSSFTTEMAASFKAELEGIGAVLTKRVELEESRLYTLYLPNY